MEKAFEISKISADEQSELEKFVQEIVDMGFDRWQEVKQNLQGYQKKLIRFFTLPRSPLHEEYLRIMAEPAKKIREEQESVRIKAEMRQSKSEFITEHLIDECDWANVKYRIIWRKHYRDPKGGANEKMLIAIPYSGMGYGKDKFGYGIIIDSSITPELFAEFCEKIPRYSGNADLISKK